jgi:hypothetical protein
VRVGALTTSTDRREFERAAALLNRLNIEHRLISPEPAYAHVGCPAVALADEAKALFLEAGRIDIVSSGCSIAESPVFTSMDGRRMVSLLPSGAPDVFPHAVNAATVSNSATYFNRSRK